MPGSHVVSQVLLTVLAWVPVSWDKAQAGVQPCLVLTIPLGPYSLTLSAPEDFSDTHFWETFSILPVGTFGPHISCLPELEPASRMESFILPVCALSVHQHTAYSPQEVELLDLFCLHLPIVGTRTESWGRQGCYISICFEYMCMRVP